MSPFGSFKGINSVYAGCIMVSIVGNAKRKS